MSALFFVYSSDTNLLVYPHRFPEQNILSPKKKKKNKQKDNETASMQDVYNKKAYHTLFFSIKLS